MPALASHNPGPVCAAQSVPYNVLFNGFQGPAEEIPPTDPLVAVPAGISAYTPYGIHVTMAGKQVSLHQLCSSLIWLHCITAWPILCA